MPRPRFGKQAELRASVFLAVDEQANAAGAAALRDSASARAKEFHATPEGAALAALVAEYLDVRKLADLRRVNGRSIARHSRPASTTHARTRTKWCNLSFTAKVFAPECDLPKDVLNKPRADLAASAGIAAPTDDVPLLAQLISSRADSPAAVLAAAPSAKSPEASKPAPRARPDSAFGSSSVPRASEQPKEEKPKAAEEKEDSSPPPPPKPLPGSLAPLGGSKLAPLGGGLAPLGGGSKLAPLRSGAGGPPPLGQLRGAPRLGEMPESPRVSLNADSEDSLPPARPASAFAEDFLEKSANSDGMDLDEDIDEDIEVDDESLPDELEDRDGASTQSFDAIPANASTVSGILASDASGEIDSRKVDLVESAEI